jgi:Tfp pilus assembly protein PilF
MMKRRIIAAFMLGFCVFWGQGCNAPGSCDSNTTANIDEIRDLRSRINAEVLRLGYPEQICDEFADMALGWKNGGKSPLIMDIHRKFSKSVQDQKNGLISKSDLSKIEQEIAGRLISQIRKRIDADTSTPGIYELSDVVRYHKAQCLGYTQVFYILASTVGLTVRPVNVLELENKKPLPAGCSHVACTVELANGTTIMSNIVPGGFISDAYTNDIYQDCGTFLQLKDNTAQSGIYGKIAILDAKGLTAYIHSNRAGGYNTSKRFNKAIAECDTAIRLCPGLDAAWNNRGIAYSRTGHIEQAVSDYARALELNPCFAEAWNNQGIAYAQSGSREHAISCYTKAIELNPVFAEAYSNRGNIYATSGQSDKAIADYDKAIELNPDLAQVYGNRGMNYAILGKAKEAKRDLALAIRLNPGLSDYAAKISQRFNLDGAITATAR